MKINKRKVGGFMKKLKLRSWVKKTIAILIIAAIMVGFTTIYQKRIETIENGKMELIYNGER